MKTPVLYCICLLGLFYLTACHRSLPTGSTAAPADLFTLLQNPGGFDSTFARKLGADQYGMKRYVLAYLKRGPNRSQDSVTVAQLQNAHLANITRLAETGKLVLAGPFMDDGEVRGIYIFDVATIEEARKLTETDPAIQAGRLVMELHPWFGTAVLPVITPLHKRVQKVKIGD